MRTTINMAYHARKTEHSGPKKGCGAYYGAKADAKKESNRRRRRLDEREMVGDMELDKQGHRV